MSGKWILFLSPFLFLCDPLLILFFAIHLRYTFSDVCKMAMGRTLHLTNAQISTSYYVKMFNMFQCSQRIWACS